MGKVDEEVVVVGLDLTAFDFFGKKNTLGISQRVFIN